MFRVVQLSDTHFGPEGHRSHRGMGYDTHEAARAVLAHMRDRDEPDLVILTGDVGDTGSGADYRRAAEILAPIEQHIHVLPGNHDLHAPLEAMLSRPGITMTRTLRVRNWLFLLVDSNDGGKITDEHGHSVDHGERMEADPRLGPRERAWIDHTISASDADHVFIWTHHPPGGDGIFGFDDYDAEFEALIAANPTVRGIGAGHVHTDATWEIGERQVHICPALTINIDLDRYTSLPPGYRAYTFADDGTIATTAHLIEDDRWPRWDFPAAARRYFEGALDWDDMVTEVGLEG